MTVSPFAFWSTVDVGGVASVLTVVSTSSETLSALSVAWWRITVTPSLLTNTESVSPTVVRWGVISAPALESVTLRTPESASVPLIETVVGLLVQPAALGDGDSVPVVAGLVRSIETLARLVASTFWPWSMERKRIVWIPSVETTIGPVTFWKSPRSIAASVVATPLLSSVALKVSVTGPLFQPSPLGPGERLRVVDGGTVSTPVIFAACSAVSSSLGGVVVAPLAGIWESGFVPAPIGPRLNCSRDQSLVLPFRSVCLLSPLVSKPVPPVSGLPSQLQSTGLSAASCTPLKPPDPSGH